MKLVTTTAIALAVLVTAAPAAAQSMAPSRSSRCNAPAPAQQASRRSSAEAAAQGQAVEECAEGDRRLQTAVNKNDCASIPAKVAAAQAVATTKEDRYLIGQLQLKAALAAKDNAAMAAAIDASRPPAFSTRPRRASSTSSLGATYYNDKQYAQAAAAFQKATALNPATRKPCRCSAKRYVAQGRRPRPSPRSSARSRPASPPGRSRMRRC